MKLHQYPRKLLTIFGFLFALIPSVAASSSFIELSNPRVGSCSNTSYLINFDARFSLEPGERIFYEGREPDGMRFSVVSGLTTMTSPVFDWSLSFSFAFTPYPYTTTATYLIEDNDGNRSSYATITLTCLGVNRGFTEIVVFNDPPPDNRANYRHGDFEAIAYSETDSTGQMALTLLCWDPATQSSSLGFAVSQADVADLTPGAENVLLFEAPECGAAFYYLTSGEFQLNIRYGDEIYEMIDSDLYFYDALRRRS